MRRLLRTALMAMAMLACLAPAPSAAASCPKASLADVEDEVMCPICGIPLGLAEAPQADRQRAFVQRLVDRCRSKPEIEAALVSEYGPSVLALPDEKGFNLAAYLMPALAIAAAAGGIAVAAARWQRERRRDMGEHAGPEDGPRLDPADLARLDAELERGEH